MGTEVASNNEENSEKPRSVEKPSELEEKIIRQIEYYFGDFNLRRDRFLKEEMQNDDGWVTLETLIKFNRLKQLSEDFAVISEALKKSPNKLMEVNDDCTKVRRTVPLSDTNNEERDKRTLYVKGFKKDSKLDELLDFFQDYETENITMRKRKSGNKFMFQGGVFVTFKNKEDCEAYFEKEVKYNKVPLRKERKNEYLKRKDEFFDNLRAEREQKAKERNSNAKKEHSSKVESLKANSKFKEGCLLRISGLEKNSKREEIKTAIETFGKVAFIDYFDGNEKGVIRFEEAIASDVLNKVLEEDGKKILEVGSVKATICLIEGEEEQNYFDQIFKSKANRMKGNTKFGNKGRFNRKNRDKRRKNYNASSEDQPDSKRRKLEQVEDDAADGTSNKHSEGEKNSDISAEKDKGNAAEDSVKMEEQ